jgi:diguanylate cyclase (GGDEF)-like protein
MIRKYLHRLATPGEIPPWAALIASILTMLLVLAFDVSLPADIRVHVLYIFPLAVIALHCGRAGVVAAGFALSVAFQLWTFYFHRVHEATLVTDALIAFASSVLTIVLARALREKYLATANLASYDSLTGLRNRRSFESIADMEIARQKRYGGVFSLAILDLDNFKNVNDAGGHHVGDKALRLLADVLRKYTRKSDAIARLGGDEFAILMPSTREGDCKSLCEQLSANIARGMADAGFAITASIGSATFERAPESTAGALEMADKAMYAAKAKGKICR